MVVVRSLQQPYNSLLKKINDWHYYYYENMMTINENEYRGSVGINGPLPEETPYQNERRSCQVPL